MTAINYLKLNDIDPDDFVPLLNRQKVRAHLIGHERFDADTVKAWIEAKLEMDATPGCRVRAILIDDQLAGWCGIQLEDNKYEIAIVIDDRFWGVGKRVFYEMMRWATVLGHDVLCIHLLHTRPEYQFLRKMAHNVHESEILGNRFTTYQLDVTGFNDKTAR